MVAGSRGIRRPSSTPQDAARPRSWPHRLRLCAGFRLAPSGDAVGGVVAFVVCAYRARLLRDDAFDVFLTQRGAQQRRPVDRRDDLAVRPVDQQRVAGLAIGHGRRNGFGLRISDRLRGG